MTFTTHKKLKHEAANRKFELPGDFVNFTPTYFPIAYNNPFAEKYSSPCKETEEFFAVNWYKTTKKPEVIDCVTGKIYNYEQDFPGSQHIPQDSSLSQHLTARDKNFSRLCKNALKYCFLKHKEELQSVPPNIKDMKYRDVKKQATDYYGAKHQFYKMVHSANFGSWVINSSDA